MLTASLFVRDKYAGVQFFYSVLQIKQTSLISTVPIPCVVFAVPPIS